MPGLITAAVAGSSWAARRGRPILALPILAYLADMPTRPAIAVSLSMVAPPAPRP
ncbi:MAG TPA: hypothetical protein VF933_18485 [Streptosporangiaceae bacterium]